MKKVLFRYFLVVSVFVLHVYYCFLLENQIFKSSKWRCSWDVYDTQLQDVPGTKRQWYMFFKFISETY